MLCWIMPSFPIQVKAGCKGTSVRFGRQKQNSGHYSQKGAMVRYGDGWRGRSKLPTHLVFLISGRSNSSPELVRRRCLALDAQRWSYAEGIASHGHLHELRLRSPPHWSDTLASQLSLQVPGLGFPMLSLPTHCALTPLPDVPLLTPSIFVRSGSYNKGLLSTIVLMVLLPWLNPEWHRVNMNRLAVATSEEENKSDRKYKRWWKLFTVGCLNHVKFYNRVYSCIIYILRRKKERKGKECF